MGIAYTYNLVMTSMADRTRLVTTGLSELPADYADRVYAGVLGKIIGVYLGRPVEGWSYDAIQERVGDIDEYINERLGGPLVVRGRPPPRGHPGGASPSRR